MGVVDTLITRFQADTKDYQRGVDGMLAHTEEIHSAMSKAVQMTERFAMVMGAAGTAIVGMGIVAAKRAADFEALIQSLSAVEGGLVAATKRWKELREIALAPGIGPEEAVMGYTQLRRAGVQDSMAKDMLREFANQNAAAGGGKELFGQLMYAVQQIAMSKNPLGQDVRQLEQARLPIFKMMMERYGTSQTEDLAAKGVTGMQFLVDMTEQMKKMARVGNSAKNTFENLSTSFDQGIIGMGNGINKVLMPYIDELGKAFDNLTESGVADLFGTTLAEAFATATDSIVGEGGLQGALVDLGAAAVAVAAGLRNATLNLEDIGDWFTNKGRSYNAFGPTPAEVDPKTGRLVPIKSGLGSGADVSPAEEAQQFKDIAEMEVERARRNRERKRRNENSYSIGGVMFPKPPSPSASVKAEQSLDGIASKSDKANNILQKIATNTEPLLQMRRLVTGGGDIARLGVTPVEVGGMRHGSSKRAHSMISQAIGLMIGPMIDDALRMRRT